MALSASIFILSRCFLWSNVALSSLTTGSGSETETLLVVRTAGTESYWSLRGVHPFFHAWCVAIPLRSMKPGRSSCGIFLFTVCLGSAESWSKVNLNAMFVSHFRQEKICSKLPPCLHTPYSLYSVADMELWPSSWASGPEKPLMYNIWRAPNVRISMAPASIWKAPLAVIYDRGEMWPALQCEQTDGTLGKRTATARHKDNFTLF